jgi:hypothetical protein
MKNIADLEQPSTTRRFIPANDVQNAIREIPVSSAPESNHSFLQLLERKAMEAVSLNATDMGASQP